MKVIIKVNTKLSEQLNINTLSVSDIKIKNISSNLNTYFKNV